MQPMQQGTSHSTVQYMLHTPHPTVHVRQGQPQGTIRAIVRHTLTVSSQSPIAVVSRVRSSLIKATWSPGSLKYVLQGAAGTY